MCNSPNCIKKHVDVIAIREVRGVLRDGDAYRVFVFTTYVPGKLVGSAKEWTIWPVRFFSSQTDETFFVPLHDMLPVCGESMNTWSVDIEERYNMGPAEYDYFDMPKSVRFVHDAVNCTEHVAMAHEASMRLCVEQFPQAEKYIVEFMNGAMRYIYCGRRLVDVVKLQTVIDARTDKSLSKSVRAANKQLLRDTIQRICQKPHQPCGVESLEDLQDRIKFAFVLYRMADRVFLASS
jgi:hypothetical protein